MFHLHWISTSSIPIHQGMIRDSFMKEHRNFWHLLSVENVPKRLKVAEKSGGGKGRKRKVRFFVRWNEFSSHFHFILFILELGTCLTWFYPRTPRALLSSLWFCSMFFSSFSVVCRSLSIVTRTKAKCEGEGQIQKEANWARKSPWKFFNLATFPFTLTAFDGLFSRRLSWIWNFFSF